MLPLAWLAGVAALVQSTGALDAAALAEQITCTCWQDITTCTSPDGYTSHETEWQGRTNGWDNRGNAWSTSRWRDNETTTITPPER
jgi:hypothetical protein